MRILFLTLFLVLICSLIGCSNVPITGRSQLMLVSDQEMINASNKTFAKFMAINKKKNSILQSSESENSAAITEAVNRVSQRIFDAAGLSNQVRLQTIVIKSDNKNAFVLPNGKIIIFTGLLPVTQTEDGLAAIIGHETGHYVARHGAERYSQKMLTNVILSAADLILTLKAPKYEPVVAQALGLGALYGFILPYSREHEIEADTMGLFYMSKAGYNPAEAIAVFTRLEAAGGAGPWEFISTHPSHPTRIANLRKWLPEASVYYADRGRPLPTNLLEYDFAASERNAPTIVSAFTSVPIPSYTKMSVTSVVSKTNKSGTMANTFSGYKIINLDSYMQRSTSMIPSDYASASQYRLINIRRYTGN